MKSMHENSTKSLLEANKDRLVDIYISKKDMRPRMQKAQYLRTGVSYNQHFDVYDGDTRICSETCPLGFPEVIVDRQRHAILEVRIQRMLGRHSPRGNYLHPLFPRQRVPRLPQQLPQFDHIRVLARFLGGVRELQDFESQVRNVGSRSFAEARVQVCDLLDFLEAQEDVRLELKYGCR
ncbi:MAG: hypothetical protein ACE5DM_03410 [Candidatus Nanoarchaeia archaeon]